MIQGFKGFNLPLLICMVFVQGLISHESMTGSEAKPKKQGHTDIPDTLDKAVNKQLWRLQHTQHQEKFF